MGVMFWSAARNGREMASSAFARQEPSTVSGWSCRERGGGGMRRKQLAERKKRYALS